jgi:HlyD family secretion protein
VVKIHRLPGEHCPVSEPVLSILEEGSLQVVLYLPQGASTLLAVGETADLDVEPYPQPLACAVVRLGDRYEPAPEHIKRHYRADQKLLPVYLQPQDAHVQWMALRVGGVVRLPYGVPRLWGGAGE